MYQCLTCKTIHENDSSANKIFQSGYVLVNELKVPLGICNKSNISTNQSFIKKSLSVLEAVR